MRSDSGNTTSFWMATAEMPAFTPLSRDLECDVCIVGGGICGLTTAYLLTREKQKVVLLDDGPLAGGETSRTTAHLAFYQDDGLDHLATLHGIERVRLVVNSHRAAVDRIEAIVREEQIKCDFKRVSAYLFLNPKTKREYLEKEERAAERIGLQCRALKRVPNLSWDSGPCLEFPNQGQFHPLKYLAGVTRAITSAGGRIHTGTHVKKIEGKPRRPRVTAENGHTVTANAVIVATNSPISDYVSTHVKMAPYRTFVVAARVPRGSVPHVLIWDTGDPYIYVRCGELNAEDDVLIVGGEDHKTGQKDDAELRFRRLEEWARERYPMIQAVDYWWSGQVIEPSDGLAFIGPNPDGAENVYLATADSGQGMTHGTIAGMLLTDLALDRDNPWAELYDPKRLRARAAFDMLRENFNVAVQYADWIRPGEVDEVAEVRKGEGRIIRAGTRKLAAYRDDDGRLHVCSAVCTHLKCIVDWNSAEKSWDCPCHGSRFDPYGRVLNGPAISDLEKVDVPAPSARVGKTPQPQEMR